MRTLGIILGGLAAAAAPIGAYLAVRRQRSGRVSATDADRLWDAAEKMRAEETAMRQELALELKAALRDLAEMRLELRQAHDEIIRVKREAESYRVEAEDAREELDALRTHMAALKEALPPEPGKEDG